MGSYILFLWFIADVTKKHIFSSKLKDKTACGDLKILLNHLGKASNEDENERETLLPRKNINLKLKNGKKP